jgi:LPXTG-site transpeptidase (sortase) family protein
MRLVIPVLGLDAPVEPVSVLSGGQLGVPIKNQWDGVGWYQDGPAPGARGSSVIDGHLDRPGGAPAVFWHLRELHAGDEVQVISAQGKVQRFRVRAVQAYRPQDAPLDTIFEDDSGSYLNLITCAGQWVPAQHQTTLRLVVYTTLEQS